MIEQGFEVVHAGLQRVVVLSDRRLVGKSAADVIGDDAAVGVAQGEDEVTVVEAPRRVAVEHDDGFAGPLVQKMQ